MKKMVKIPVAANKLTPSKGMMLISEPYLYDPNFNRTVVLLTEHNKDGSLGFILNKELELTVSEVLDKELSLQLPVFYGGPVKNNTLHFIHTEPALSEGAVDLGNGIFWGGNFKAVEEMMASGNLEPNHFRFFLGYSGWGQGQLITEIHENSWFVLPPQNEIIFSLHDDSLWKKTMKTMGQEFKILSNSPKNPHWN